MNHIFKKFLISAAVITLGGALSVNTALAQRDYSKVQIKTIKLTDNLHMLMGAGGNIGVSSGADGVFMIDDQFAPLSDKISAAVTKISSKPIRFLLNTH